MKVKLTCFQLSGVYDFPFTDSGSLFKLLKGLLWRRRHKFLCNALRRGSSRRRPCRLQGAALFSVPILTTWVREQPSYPESSVRLISLASQKMSLGRCLKRKGGRWREQNSDSSANESAGMELTSRGGQSFMKWFIWILSVCWSITRTLRGRKSDVLVLHARVLLSVSSVWDSCIWSLLIICYPHLRIQFWTLVTQID